MIFNILNLLYLKFSLKEYQFFEKQISLYSFESKILDYSLVFLNSSQTTKFLNSMKKVLVTGASRGLGFSITKKLVQNGFFVYAAVRDPENSKLIRKLGQQFENLEVLKLDVSSSIEINNALKNIDFLDILVNNAGYGLQGYLLDFDKEKIQQQLNVNTIAPLELMAKSFSKLKKNSLIINISSVASYLALPVGSAYGVSKIALNYFSQSFAIESDSNKNLSVVNIEPSQHKTGFMSSVDYLNQKNIESYFKKDFKSPDSPENVANLVLKLIKKKEQKKLPVYKEIPIGKNAKLLKIICKFTPQKWITSFLQSKLREKRRESIEQEQF